MIPPGVDGEEWGMRLGTLAELLGDGDDATALAWFMRQFPAELARIPRNQRGEFIAGVVEAYCEGAIGDGRL